MRNDPTTIGGAIYKMRTEQKIGLTELANKAKTQKSLISKLETGDNNVSINVLARLCKALGTDLIRFLMKLDLKQLTDKL